MPSFPGSPYSPQQQYTLPYAASPTQVSPTMYTTSAARPVSFVAPPLPPVQQQPAQYAQVPNGFSAPVQRWSGGYAKAGAGAPPMTAVKSTDPDPFGGDIHAAAIAGDVQAVRKIQKAKPHSVHAFDESGQTSLHHAVAQGHLHMIHELLSCGADIEATNHDGDTPLHHGVSEGNVEVVRLLLDKRADIEAKEKFVSGTPLHHAALHGRTNMVKALLERKPNLEAKNRKSQTPLHVAALYSHLDAAQMLLDKGANAKARDAQGNTPAGLAHKTGHTDMEDLILEAL